MGSFRVSAEYIEDAKKSRSPSFGRVGYDTYMLYNSYTGNVIKAEGFTVDVSAELRMLDIQYLAADILKCSTSQITMHKELDVRSGECKVFLTNALLE